MAFWKAPDEKQDASAPQPAVGSENEFASRFKSVLDLAARGQAGESAVQGVNMIIDEAVRQGASDVHVEHHGGLLRLRFRVDGMLLDVLRTAVPPDFSITQRFRILAGFDPKPGGTFRSEDGRFTVLIQERAVQCRCSVFPTIDGESVVLRIFDQAQLGLGLDQIGFQPDTLQTLNRVIKLNHGLFFVTGATGCGKTTTLYGILQKLNQPHLNVITLEDPVEFRLQGINQAQINPKAGFTFDEALRGVLRQDPNVVMVGEIRDYATAEIAMRAAQTGHLVLSTLHTISAPGVVDRLFEMGVQPFLMTSSMIGVLAQRLIRRLCPNCAKPSNPPPETVTAEFIKTLDPEEGTRVRQLLYRQGATYKIPGGCPNCRNTGYAGRTGIFELMMMNEHLRGHILAKSPPDLLRRTAIQTGMRTQLMDGVIKATMGITSLDEVLRSTSTIST